MFMFSDVKLKLAPPWITYVNKIKALFGSDPDINIVYDNDDPSVKIFVENHKAKAVAIERLLPDFLKIGNVNLDIIIIPSNEKAEELLLDDDLIDSVCEMSMKRLFDTAFDGNPVYAYSKEVVGVFSNVLTYVVFKNRVVQFFNDNLNDIHGLISTLYQDIAKELFGDLISTQNPVFFNTDIEEKVGMSLGEWP